MTFLVPVNDWESDQSNRIIASSLAAFRGRAAVIRKRQIFGIILEMVLGTIGLKANAFTDDASIEFEIIIVAENSRIRRIDNAVKTSATAFENDIVFSQIGVNDRLVFVGTIVVQTNFGVRC